ncbi:MAG: hypothetical protein QM769_14385 [Pseudoxanthomonas sp.]
METLRENLVQIALNWEQAFGNAPSVTSAVSEYDAAQLVGCTTEEYSQCMQGSTAVQKGYDFIFNGVRYQVKANRPSGKRGSKVSWVPKAKNYDWDCLIWILYDPQFRMQEAWLWDVAEYQDAFDTLERLSPAHMRQGKRLAGTTEREVVTAEEAAVISNRAISENDVLPDGWLTAPRSYGVYALPVSATDTRRYRIGNHPVRQRELEQEFGSCELVFLFLHRVDAVAMAAALNHDKA